MPPPRRPRLRRNPQRLPRRPRHAVRRGPPRRSLRRRTAEDNFGRERQVAAEEQKRQQDEARSLGELEAYVTGIETRMDGLMTFTLDNGQVWRQNSPDSKFHLKEGDRVKIQPGSMKSFILSGPSKKSTRVTRVK